MQRRLTGVGVVQQAVYPHQTADRAVTGFLGSYTRASLILSKILAMDPRDLRAIFIKLFMYDNRQWNVVRDVVKGIERSSNPDQLATADPAMIRNYLTNVKHIPKDSILFNK